MIEVEEKKHYLLSVTEAGEPVSGGLQLRALMAGAPKVGVLFQDIMVWTTTTELIPGVLEVTMSSLPFEVSSDTIFQFQVQHDHGDDESPFQFQHLGTALVSGDSNSISLGPGQ